MTRHATINILGVDLTERDFPNLYPIAAKNREYVAGWLLSLMKRTGSDDIGSTATILEHDLEHERLVAKPSGSADTSIVDNDMVGFFDLLARHDFEDKVKEGRKAIEDESKP